jgi:hypothetical protein
MLRGKKLMQKHLNNMPPTTYKYHMYFNLQFHHLATCVMFVKDFLILKLKQWGA